MLKNFSFSNFSEFVSGLCDEITEIYNAKRVNDVNKYPKSNSEYWVEIADTITDNCPNIEVWGCYNPDDDGVTVEVRNKRTTYKKWTEAVNAALHTFYGEAA